MPEAHPEPALLTTARSVFEADVIVGVLAEEGIPAYRPGGMLTDEFAISQQLMGLQGVSVYVPENRLDEARKALRRADEAGRIFTPDDKGRSEEP